MAPILDAAEQKAKDYVLRNFPAGPGVAITPLLMGMIIDAVLMGIMLSQLIHWFSHQRSQESKAHQYAVMWCSVMGCCVFLLSTGWILYLFGYNFGRWAPLTDYRWLSLYPLVDASMVLVVQAFYAERAYKIANRAKVLIPMVAIPMIVSAVGGVGVAVCGFTDRVISTNYKIFVWFWIAGCFVADLIITSIVLWGLTRSRSPWEQTDILVKRLIRVACESQLPPTVIAFALLIDWIVQRDTFYGVFFEMVQGKVYVVGMIYVLNQRFYLRRELDGENNNITAVRPSTFSNFKGGRNRNGAPLGPATIHVQTETYVESHQINPAFMPQRLQPKIREASESGDTEMSELDGVNQSEVGLNSEYMERVRAARKKPQFNVASFAAMG
ncbi:hypothetical protein CspHIS471_0510000 [Cutaneotrichosporon sp. HIS471]|nr:hypothetical protein CspHIS471_0510000 [Cutaneotrichosporon sp. HIS471]